ncbi:hypothetical protein BVG16_27660 [Paenibacillus selenitireducens]|uniref:Uncharacterized protein n=1 Tax=Paenibacillus selenitireducens TaxID=1324314 RepID=A0A1T2X135_9BACL|nr:hypothetical protein [Paenibacillus selenitireducens]OPA73590.1 hypothetical protein BVG16_27660 [Paenibacillus selenitireducens]
MKKTVYLIVVILLLFSFFIVKYNSGAKTIQEALSISHPERIVILHEEKTKDGILVFYQISKNDFSAAVVKKRFGNYRVMYSGAQGEIHLTLDRFGFTYMFFPAIKNTSFPIYFGLIRNPEITQIKIVEKKRNMEEKAKIIEGTDARIWLLDMKKFEGSEFQIIALSEDNKEIAKRDDNISLQVADQNPIQGE